MRWCTVVAFLNLLVPPLLRARDADMHGLIMHGPHITLSPRWVERVGDRARADSLVRVAREAAERYRDVAVAKADGYRRFAPQVRNQRVYHYSSTAAAFKARFRFDPASPTALRYQDDTTDGLRLVGVMYTMPTDAPLEELDRRIPLSIARWHQHTNRCLPPRGADESRAMLARMADFGPRGPLATREACEGAGGRWFARMFGWMVHLNLFAPPPEGVWSDGPGGMRHP
jgi:hypothetical protein